MDTYFEKTAVIDDKGNTLTYGQLNNYKYMFRQLIGSRKLIAIIASNTIESLIGYISCIQSGNIPLMLRHNIDQESLNDYLVKFNVNFIWMSASKEEEYNKRNKIEVKEYDFEHIYSYGEYSLYKVSDRKVNVHDELALLLTTSGSTGAGKLVRISYKNLESNTGNIAKSLDITDKDIAATSLPMNYTYGLSVINTHLYKKAALLVTQYAPYSKEFWDLFRKYSVTSFAGVPYTYETLRKMGFHKMKLPSLKTLTVAGGKLGSAEEKYYVDYALENAKNFIVMYGQTEATARISYRPKEVMSGRMGSIGVPIPEGEIWLEDDKGKKIDKAYFAGELVYSGSNVSMGYAFSTDDLARGYDWGDVLHTGDIGYRDEMGYLFLTGRKDRMVKVNGIRVDLDEMEKMLKEQFGEYEFNCGVEKCVDTDFFKKIRIQINDTKVDSVSENKSGNDMHKRSRKNGKGKITEDEVLEYVSGKMGFSTRYYHIIIE